MSNMDKRKIMARARDIALRLSKDKEDYESFLDTGIKVACKEFNVSEKEFIKACI